MQSQKMGERTLLKYVLYFTIALLLLVCFAFIGCSTKADKRNNAPVIVAEEPVIVSNVHNEAEHFAVEETDQVPAAKMDRVYYFGFNSDVLHPDTRYSLREQVDYLKKHSKFNVLLAGHADIRGSREYNMALGERRATRVKDYLVAHGISSSRIQVVSYGKEKPIVSGFTEVEHAKNRRVELSYKLTF